MSTPQINAAKLSLRNESALCLHHIDRIFAIQEQIEIANDGDGPQRELAPDQIAEACANFACLLDVSCNAIENGVVTIEELAFTDKIATPGGIYIDPNIPDPEDC